MPNRSTSLKIASVLALMAGAAMAQPAPKPPASVAPVTVQVAPTKKSLNRQTYDFALSFAGVGNPELDQIGRWWDPVCVRVAGASEGQEAQIKARIEGVADTLGLPKARPNCTANVQIVFTDKPQAVMDIVYRRREEILGYYHMHDGKRLKAVTRPIQAWYVTATEANGGNSAAFVTGVSSPTSSQMIDDPENRTPTGCGYKPHFSACTHSLIKNAFVVADTKALEGKDTGLIADYLVMMALARPLSTEGCKSMPTVLEALSSAACPHDRPEGLTPSDAAYLTALYKTDLDARKNFEEGEIADRMAAILVQTAGVVRK